MQFPLLTAGPTGKNGTHPMRFIVITPLLLLGSIGIAHATANVGCAAKDSNLNFSVDALEGRIAGGPLIDMKIEAELLAARIPADYRSVMFASEDLIERWTMGSDFRLHFHREVETKKHYLVYDLAIMTEEDPESEGLGFKGSYILSFTANPLAEGETVEETATGDATCYGG
jgi:hypothetical protein